MSQNQRNNIISLFIEHPVLFLRFIGTRYALSNKQMNKYSSVLNWRDISENSNINWSLDTVNQFKDKIDWSLLTTSCNIMLDKEFLEKFDDRIDWYGNDFFYRDSIVENRSIYWDEETIDKYAHKINFEKLSRTRNVAWSGSLIDKYHDKLSCLDLSNNESIPWTVELFEKYFDESYFSTAGLQINKSLLSFDFIEKYDQWLSWYYISLNPHLPWIEKDLLNRWSDKIDWSGIALNKFLFANDKTFYLKHQSKWHYIKNIWFYYFSGNDGFPWTKELIQQHKDEINWDNLSTNESIDWNCDLIDTFIDYIKWGGWVSSPLYDENGEMISPTGSKSIEQGLIQNKSVPWSIDILCKYEKHIDFDAIKYNSVLWDKAFKNNVDDELIDTVMRII